MAYSVFVLQVEIVQHAGGGKLQQKLTGWLLSHLDGFVVAINQSVIKSPSNHLVLGTDRRRHCIST